MGLLTYDVFEQLNKLTFSLAATANEICDKHHDHPPSSNRDKLNITLSFARAWMRKDLKQMNKLTRAYEELQQYNGNYSKAAERKLNELIKTLHDASLKDDLIKLDELLSNDP